MCVCVCVCLTDRQNSKKQFRRRFSRSKGEVEEQQTSDSARASEKMNEEGKKNIMRRREKRAKLSVHGIVFTPNTSNEKLPLVVFIHQLNKRCGLVMYFMFFACLCNERNILGYYIRVYTQSPGVTDP